MAGSLTCDLQSLRICAFPLHVGPVGPPAILQCSKCNTYQHVKTRSLQAAQGLGHTQNLPQHIPVS